MLSFIVTSLASTLLLVGTLTLLTVMLRRDAARVLAILSGRELVGARTAAPEVRVRVRAWRRAEVRGFGPPRRAAAA